MSTLRTRDDLRSWILMVVALVALAPRLFVSWSLPLAAAERPDCAPDEGMQFWTVTRYAGGDFRTWPASGSIYSAYPPVQYGLHAAALATIRSTFGDRWPARFPSSWWRLQSYTAARLGGVLLGVLTALIAFRVAELWGGGRRLALASGLAVALHPQLVFVNAYVNGDSFTIAAVALLVLALSRWAVGGEGAARLGWVGAAAGVVLLGKPAGYVALLPTAVWVAVAWRRGRVRAASLLAAGAATALTGAPILAWNAVRNGGDPLGLGKYRELLRTAYQAHPASGGPLAQLPTFVRDLFGSSFGVFRNADLPLPGIFFVGAAAFLAAGIGLAGVRMHRTSGVARRMLGWLLATICLALGLVIWNSWTVDYQPQGRYLLPALVPVWVAVTCELGRSRRGPLLLAAWLGFLATATGTALWLIHANPCVGA